MRAVDQHRFTPEDIMEFLDGEGAPAAREAIAAHIPQCAECQQVMADHRDLSHRAQAWTVEPAPSSLRPPAIRSAWWTPTPSLLRRPRVAALTLVAAAVVVIAFVPGVKRRALSTKAETVAVDSIAPATRAGRVAGQSGGGGAPGGVVGSVLGGLPGSPPAPPPPPARAFTQVRTPAVIRTATLRLIAKDVAGARASVESLVVAENGFVDEMTVTGDASVQRQLLARLRVPGDRLADTLARLRQLGAIVEDTQGSEDVTDQLVDLDARLANARATEKRLADILANRTGRLSDVLEVERELARVRLDIERLDAEKTNMARRVTYATISLSISEERKSLDGPLTLATRLRLASLDGLDNALESAAAAVLFALRAGPTLVLWGAIATALFLLARRFRSGIRDSGSAIRD